MSEPTVAQQTLVLAEEDGDGLHIAVNFGIFAGRTATPAEIERLADALLQHAPTLEIVAEERYELDRERRGTVYQVRIEVPAGGSAGAGALVEAARAWARECLADRRLITP